MGSCLSSSSANGGVAVQTQPQSKKSKPKSFQGKGNRLGSANEAPTEQSIGRRSEKTNIKNDDVPAKRVDTNLSDSEREKQRDARLAAAENRLKKQSGGSTKPKKKNTGSLPLKGPNTEPLMRWTS